MNIENMIQGNPQALVKSVNGIMVHKVRGRTTGSEYTGTGFRRRYYETRPEYRIRKMWYGYRKP